MVMISWQHFGTHPVALVSAPEHPGCPAQVDHSSVLAAEVAAIVADQDPKEHRRPLMENLAACHRELVASICAALAIFQASAGGD
jgi:hypothetical protein